jgi:hypothetical protein
MRFACLVGALFLALPALRCVPGYAAPRSGVHAADDTPDEPSPDRYEPDHSPSRASQISLGGTQQHTIDYPDDVDWVRFTLNARRDVTLTTNGSSGDTLMVLFGPNSSTLEVARDDDHGSGEFAKITRRGLEPGHYYVRINERGRDATIDGYTLRLTSERSGDMFEPDDSPERASGIALNSVQSRSLDVATDLDWVRFRLFRQSAVTVETSGASGSTELFLYGPNSSGQEIARDDDGGPELFSRLQQLLPAGEYYLRVQAHAGSAAIPAYTLRLDAVDVGDVFEPDNTADQPSALETGGTQTRSLDPAGDVDWGRFTLARNSYVTVETTGATELALFRDGSATPLAVDEHSNGQCSQIVQPLLPAGDYLVRVRNPQGALVPSYLLTLLVSDAFEPDDTPETARPIALGETQERSIHRAGDVDWVRFVLTTMSPVTLETNGTEGITELTLFAEGQLDSPLAEDDHTNGAFSRIRQEALPPGAYLVRVRVPGDAAPLGRYRLTLSNTDAYEADDTPETAGEIAVGETQTRSLPVRTDVDWVRLTLTETTKVVITTAGPVGDTELVLYSPTPRLRKLISNNEGGVGSFSRIAKKLKPGTYLILVRAFRARAEVPRYTLSVTAAGQ